MDLLRPLGRTGLRVSAIGLGTVKLGRTQGVAYPAPFQLPSDQEAGTLLRTACELGVTLLDTAPAYGSSEERLGELMRRHAWFGGRNRWIVSTKAGEEFEHGVSRFDFSPDAIRASAERSCRRLGVETLDILMLHSSGEDVRILRESGAVEELAALKRRGVIRAAGISSKTTDGGLLALELGLDVLMVVLNARDESQLPVIAEAGRRGAGVLIKKGLASGHAAVGSPIAGADPAREALRFVFERGGNAVSGVVTGTINPAHLRANVAAAAAVLRA
jgi:aryl-alcohol dehydrogenase-like predicted oxidoreductase